MRQATARATRRDLRRAMGEAGVDALATAQQSMASLSTSLGQAHRDITSLKKEATGLQNVVYLQGLELVAVESRGKDRLTLFVGQSLWSRLRWLLRGR